MVAEKQFKKKKWVFLLFVWSSRGISVNTPYSLTAQSLVHKCVWVCIYVHMCVECECEKVCVSVHVCVYLHICVCMRVCVWVCVCVCKGVWVCVCMSMWVYVLCVGQCLGGNSPLAKKRQMLLQEKDPEIRYRLSILNRKNPKSIMVQKSKTFWASYQAGLKFWSWMWWICP